MMMMIMPGSTFRSRGGQILGGSVIGGGEEAGVAARVAVGGEAGLRELAMYDYEIEHLIGDPAAGGA